MSAQPSLPFNQNNNEHGKWKEIVKLAELLLLQTDLESQLACIISTFEHTFRCEAKLWLADACLKLVRNEILLEKDIHLSTLSDLMAQAFSTKQIIPPVATHSMTDELPALVALPLVIREEVLGVIQLDRLHAAGFNDQDIEFISGFGIESALVLDWKRKDTISYDLRQKNEFLTVIAQISKSIASNLDLDNLVNSIITLIHQRFDYSRVNLYLVQGEDKENLSVVGISPQGIEPQKIFSCANDDNPIAWSVHHQEPVIINNIRLETRFSPTAFDIETKSELIIPLVNAGVFLGLLDLCSGQVDAFKPDVVSVFKTLAENISVAVRNVRLYRIEQLRRQVAQSIQAVIKEISADISLGEVLDRLLMELGNIIHYDAAAIWLYDNVSSENGKGQSTSSLKIAAVAMNGSDSLDDQQIKPINTDEIKEKLAQGEDDNNSLLLVYPWLAEIIASQQPVIKESESLLEPLGQTLSFAGQYSALGGSLYLDNQPLGLIILVDQVPGRYSSESQLIASTFCDYASTAVQNARLFTGAHEQVWLSTVLLQVAETTQSMNSMTELLEAIASMMIDLADVNGCMVYLWDQSIQAFFPQASFGFENEQQARLKAWEISIGSVPGFDELLHSKSPVILSPDALPEEISGLIFPSYDLYTDLLILFPMISQGELLGAFLIDFTNTGFSKTSSQKQWDDMYLLVQGVTHQTATAIENLQMIKSREEEAYISIALLQVAQAIVSLNQLDEVLSSIVRITPILVGVRRCIIYLWDNVNMIFRPSQYYGFSKSDIPIEGQAFRSDEYPFIETILVQNQIAYHPLAPNSTPSSWSEIESTDIYMIEGTVDDSDGQYTLKLEDKQLRDKSRLLIGFPLSVKSEVLGVMLVEEEEPTRGLPKHHIREKRIEIVRGITQQAAIAIKNEYLQQEAVKSERMERELQLAREIQVTFLPDHLPDLHGWDMNIRWQTARQVGGDFYDALLLDENHLGFVIADVADKGMPAALFMTLIRTLIRAAAKDNMSPASVLKQVNELLIPDTKQGMFVTVFYGVFYLDTGKLIYANAGHNPPLVKHIQSDDLIELTRTSMALGIFDDIEVDEREVILNPGDWILLYTDGVTEAFSAHEEMFGTTRLFELLLNRTYASSIELLDTIEKSVQVFIEGVELSDDLTLAAIFRRSA